MNMVRKLIMLVAAALFGSLAAFAQDDVQQADSSAAPKLINLEQSLQIALSENASVKVADMEIERTGRRRSSGRRRNSGNQIVQEIPIKVIGPLFESLQA